jgi:putative tryptophan/tyrosine transport system substrate-binding protein
MKRSLAQMKRRDFLVLLGGAPAWSVAAEAQQPVTQVIGFLSARSPGEATPILSAFLQGLRETGHVEGKNVRIDYRWAEGHYDRLPALAAELVNSQVAVIAATGGDPSPLAAKAATTTIPIVFTMGGDPVLAGLVSSLSRPGNNITGATLMGVELAPKRLELIRQLLPNATALGVLINEKFPQSAAEVGDTEAAARSLGIKIAVMNASTEPELTDSFARIAQQKLDALVVGTDPFLLGQRSLIAKLGVQHRVPTMYHLRDFVVAGGLLSYGPSIAEAYRQAGIYTGRILNGEKPAELPVLQPTNFLFSINLRTARALGLQIPAQLLALADEVIE